MSTTPTHSHLSSSVSTRGATIMQHPGGWVLLDCSGTSVIDATLEHIPLEREGDVVLFMPQGTTITGEDLRTPMNLFTSSSDPGVLSAEQHAAIVGLSMPFDYHRFPHPERLQEAVQYAVWALLEGESAATLWSLSCFFADPSYRAAVLERATTERVRHFWAGFPTHADEQGWLASLARRIDQCLAHPDLLAMSVAPESSIDLRAVLDRHGILLAECPVGHVFDHPLGERSVMSCAATWLVAQMIVAGLGRSDWPSVPPTEQQPSDQPAWVLHTYGIDRLFTVAPLLWSQLQSAGIQVVFPDRPSCDLSPEVASVIFANAHPQSRLIMKESHADAPQASGLQTDDVKGLPRQRHHDQQQGVPPVLERWHDIRAAHLSDTDQEFDQFIAGIQTLAQERPDEAIQRLGLLCRDQPQVFAAYCRRTREHRAAQRQFILDYPDCITADPGLDGPAAAGAQKRRRITILSALAVGVPQLELHARCYALLAR